jgi:hypothetical protein
VNVKADVIGSTIGQASMQLVAPGNIYARNTLDDRYAVRPKAAKVRVDGRIVTFTLPAYSAAVTTLQTN